MPLAATAPGADVKIWVDAASRERADAPRDEPSPSFAPLPTPPPPADAVGTDSADDTEEEDDDRGEGCAECTATAAESLAYLLARRLDVVLGLAALAVALWLRVDDAFHDDAKDASASLPWRAAAFAACVLLGRLVSRAVIRFTTLASQQIAHYRRRYAVLRANGGEGGGGGDASSSSAASPSSPPGGGDRRASNTVLYYLHVLRSDLRALLFFAGVAVAWSTLMRPLRDRARTEYDATSRSFASACVLLALRCVKNFILRRLTGALHSNTFWEQLHATVRHEMILRKLAGAPIRPRPKSGGARRRNKLWTLVKNTATAAGTKTSAATRSPSKGPSSKAPRPGVGSVGSEDSYAFADTPDSGSGANGMLAAETTVTTVTTVPTAALSSGAPPPPPSRDPPPPSSGPPSHSSSSSSSSSSAAAADAAASVGATKEPADATSVPMATIDAAVRHVRRGTRGFTTLLFGGKHSPRSASAGSRGGGDGKTSRHPAGVSSGGSLPRGAVRKRLTDWVTDPTSVAQYTAGALGDDASLTEREADRAACLMFHHLRRRGAPFVTPDAVGDFVEPGLAREAFRLIGGVDAGVEALAESNIQAAMRKIYLDREALGRTLADTNALVGSVGALLTFALGAVGLFASLAIFRVDVANLWLLISSGLLAFAFVFGATAATMFRALIMIFVTNPFGVGDWIRVGEGLPVRVRELGLNFFVVDNFWGERLYLPASSVLDAQTHNLSRSPPLWVKVSIDVDVGVMTASALDRLQSALQTHVDSDGGNYARGSCEVYLQSVENPLKVRVACFYQLAFNASEFVAKLRANNRFLLAFQIALAACDVTYAGTDGQIFACKEMEEDGSCLGGENDALGGGSSSLRERDFLGAEGPSRTPSRRVSATEFGARAKEARGGGGAAVSRRNSRTETRDERARDEKAPDEDFGGGGGGDAEAANDGGSALRRRPRRRIPGRVRHYSGMLAHMRDVIEFDA